MATRVREPAAAGERSKAGDVATVISLPSNGKEYLYRSVHNQSSISCMLAVSGRPAQHRFSVRDTLPASVPRRTAMKVRRQSAILDAVQHQPVRSQEQLRRRLRSAGFDVPQATLSRDIRELQLMKGGPDGAYQAPA